MFFFQHHYFLSFFAESPTAYRANYPHQFVSTEPPAGTKVRAPLVPLAGNVRRWLCPAARATGHCPGVVRRHPCTFSHCWAEPVRMLSPSAKVAVVVACCAFCWAEPVRMVSPFASKEVAVAAAGESCGSIPRRDSNGVCSVASAGFKVHGRMYTHSRRAFSSGDRVTRGTLA